MARGLDSRHSRKEDLCAKSTTRAFMRRLTASARLPRSLILRYHEGLSMEDVATGLKVKLSAAKMRVHRGLAKFARHSREENKMERRTLKYSRFLNAPDTL